MIAEIKDKSLEFPDSIDFIYQVLGSGNVVVAELINVPVEVFFELESEAK